MFQEELGGEEWTPHLQGLIHNRNQVAVTTLKAWNPRIHWEPTRDIKSSIKYCSDPEKRAPLGRMWSFGFTLPNTVQIIPEDGLYTWQRSLITELQAPPDDRTILWYCDRHGGAGKTALAKYIYKSFPRTLFFSGGKFTDISYQVVKCKFDPSIIVINLPRTSEGKVSYASIEALKDGFIQSGKYEGGTKLFPNPHVVVFANFVPDFAALSQDRWILRELNH